MRLGTVVQNTVYALNLRVYSAFSPIGCMGQSVDWSGTHTTEDYTNWPAEGVFCFSGFVTLNSMSFKVFMPEEEMFFQGTQSQFYLNWSLEAVLWSFWVLCATEETSRKGNLSRYIIFTTQFCSRDCLTGCIVCLFSAFRLGSVNRRQQQKTWRKRIKGSHDVYFPCSFSHSCFR